MKKAPNSKLQTPEKLQISKSKSLFGWLAAQLDTATGNGRASSPQPKAEALAYSQVSLRDKNPGIEAGLHDDADASLIGCAGGHSASTRNLAAQSPMLNLKSQINAALAGIASSPTIGKLDAN